MIKAIIFDYDGVIVDSFPKVHEVYKIASEEIGTHCPSNFDDFVKMYGKSAAEFKRNAKMTKEQIAAFDVIFKREIVKQNPDFYHGIKEVIQTLSKKYRLFLVSANLHEEVHAKMVSAELQHYFQKIVGGQVGPLHKKEPILDILNEERCRPDDVIMIGDRVMDYKVAKECGITNILLVEYGWGYDKNEIPNHRQVVLVHKPSDILDAVRTIAKNKKVAK